MTLRYLLDTSTVSLSEGRFPDAVVVSALRLMHDEAAIASVVWYELSYGMELLPPSRRKAELREFLSDVVEESYVILPYDAVAAEWNAREAARLELLGLRRPFRDSQIASVAAVNGLILVTANMRDFEHFRDLRVEDWSTPRR